MSKLVMYLGAFGKALITSCSETGVSGSLITCLLLALRSKTNLGDCEFFLCTSIIGLRYSVIFQ